MSIYRLCPKRRQRRPGLYNKGMARFSKLRIHCWRTHRCCPNLRYVCMEIRISNRRRVFLVVKRRGQTFNKNSRKQEFVTLQDSERQHLMNPDKCCWWEVRSRRANKINYFRKKMKTCRSWWWRLVNFLNVLYKSVKAYNRNNRLWKTYLGCRKVCSGSTGRKWWRFRQKRCHQEVHSKSKNWCGR